MSESVKAPAIPVVSTYRVKVTPVVPTVVGYICAGVEMSAARHAQPVVAAGSVIARVVTPVQVVPTLTVNAAVPLLATTLGLVQATGDDGAVALPMIEAKP